MRTRAALPTRYAHARAQQMLKTPETVQDGKIETGLKPVPIPCFGWSLKLISLKIAALKKIASTVENDPSKGPSNQVQTEARLVGACFRFTPSPGSSKFYSHLANGFNSN